MSDNDELRGWPAAIGVVVLALIFGGVVLAIYPGWDSIGGFLVKNLKLTDQAPAWVQAVGSILAIFAAGFFPIWHQIINQKKNDKIRRRNALYIYMSHRDLIYNFELELRMLFKKLRDNNKMAIKKLNNGNANQLMDIILNLIPDVNLGKEDFIELDFLSSDASALLSKSFSKIRLFRYLIKRCKSPSGDISVENFKKVLSTYCDNDSSIRNDLLFAYNEYNQMAIADGILHSK